MSRHKKRTELSETELARFVAAATELNDACSRADIAPQGEHYRALNDLSAAIVEAIRKVSGSDPRWMQPTPAHWHPGHPIHKEAQ